MEPVQDKASPSPPPAIITSPAVQAAPAEKGYRANLAGRAAFTESRAASPPPAASVAAEAAAGAEDIVVTSHRVEPRARAGRGDWNACTVNDPSRNLGRCKRLVDPGAKGPAGRAAARLAEGLTLAWQGDDDGAITAFDQAIELEPRLAFAYLNRGLARQREGDLDRALADLDRAVRYAPGAARGYYHRSLVLRARGDTRRARADEDRTIELDPSYDAVIE